MRRDAEIIVKKAIEKVLPDEAVRQALEGKVFGNGRVYIADPVNYENCTLEWDLELLLSELKKSYDNGGPLWAVSPWEFSSVRIIHSGFCTYTL